MIVLTRSVLKRFWAGRTVSNVQTPLKEYIHMSAYRHELCVCAGWYMWITCYHICALTDLHFFLFQTASLSLRSSCRFKGGRTLVHRSNCWSGDSPATLFLFCLTITSVGIVVCTLSGPQEGMESVFFIQKNYFHLRQQLEAKSKVLLVSAYLVAGAGFVCDVPS